MENGWDGTRGLPVQPHVELGINGARANVKKRLLLLQKPLPDVLALTMTGKEAFAR